MASCAVGIRLVLVVLGGSVGGRAYLVHKFIFVDQIYQLTRGRKRENIHDFVIYFLAMLPCDSRGRADLVILF
jgi:hypothetical protein